MVTFSGPPSSPPQAQADAIGGPNPTMNRVPETGQLASHPHKPGRDHTARNGRHDSGSDAESNGDAEPERSSRHAVPHLQLVCDGLKGLPDAVNTVWDKTIVQTCVIHYADLRIMPTWSRHPLRGRDFVLARSA
jgi:Transposase, Mutator family